MGYWRVSCFPFWTQAARDKREAARNVPVCLASSAGKHIGLFPFFCGSQNVFIFYSQPSSVTDSPTGFSSCYFSHAFIPESFQTPGFTHRHHLGQGPSFWWTSSCPLFLVWPSLDHFTVLSMLCPHAVGGQGRTLSGSPAVTTGTRIQDKCHSPTA